MYEVELEEDLKSDTSGDFEKLMVSLVSGARQEGVDEGRAEEEAQELIDVSYSRAASYVDCETRRKSQLSNVHVFC